MTFRVGGETYYCYLNIRGQTHRISTGTRLATRAREIERAVKALGPRGTNDTEILDAVAARRLTLPQVFDAVQGRTLDQLRRSLRDTDLATLVDDWVTGAGLRPRTATEYTATLRKMIPEGQAFPASTFTRGALQRHLDQWRTGSRNKYRSVFSRFADWLVARDVLPMNPAKLTTRASEADPRVVWYTPEQAKALIGAVPMPYQALEALMCGSGIDLGAALAATRNDVDEDRRTVFSHGPTAAGGKLKTRHRVRDCVVTEGWCWDIFWPHARGLLGGARLFPHDKHTIARWHRKAVQATQLHPSWARDWRHTFAVTHRLRGTPDWQIAEYLGHANTLLVQSVYGRFKATGEQLSYKQHQGQK